MARGAPGPGRGKTGTHVGTPFPQQTLTDLGISKQQLAQYDRMRTAVAQCARVDEAAVIRDKAAALAAYARQRDDNELDVWMSEIKLRACTRIGELSRGLEKAGARGRGPVSLPSRGKRKADILADAGISTSSAQRYEEIAGGPTEQGQRTAGAAAEAYFAKAKAENKPGSLEGLRGAIRGAMTEAFGPRQRSRLARNQASQIL